MGQLGRYLRFHQEACDVSLVPHGCGRQYLHGNNPRERNLFCFEHHAHAAATNLANQSIVAKRLAYQLFDQRIAVVKPRF